MRPFRLWLLLLTLAVRAAALSPEALITQLAAESRAERNAAEQELLRLGPSVLPALRAAFNHPDPELRFRAQRIYEQLRYGLAPGIPAAEIKALLASRGKALIEAWKGMVQQHGAATLPLLPELQHIEDLPRDLCTLARRIYWLELDAAEIVTALKALPDLAATGPLPPELLPPMNESGLVARLVEVYLLLERPAEAWPLALEAWLYAGKSAKLATARQAALSANLLPALWEKVPGAAVNLNSPKRRERWIRLQLLLALESDQKGPPLEWMKAYPVDLAPNSELTELFQQLADKGWHQRLELLVAEASTPLPIYLRFRVHAGSKQPEKALEDFKQLIEAFEKLKGGDFEQECYAVGSAMQKGKDPNVEIIWNLLFDRAKPNDVYAANAALRLAPFAEKRGEFAKAADLYEYALKATQGKSNMGVLVQRSDGKQGASGEETLQEIIARLREKAAAKTPPPDAEN